MNFKSNIEKRNDLLVRLYEISNGDIYHRILYREVGEELGLSKEEADNIAIYLHRAGLLHNIDLGFGARISVAGVQYVENLHSPMKSTSTQNIVNNFIGNSICGLQLQQASNNSSQTFNVKQTNANPLISFLQETKAIINKLDLCEDNKSDLIGNIETIETQLKCSNPKWAFIKECFTSIRTMLEGAAGGVLAQAAISHAPSALAYIQKMI